MDRPWFRHLMPFVLTLAAVGLPLPGLAQETGTIIGRVLGATGQPIGGVQVTVVAPELGALTDPMGRFRIEGVPAGDQVVRAQSIGYADEEQTVSVPPGGTVEVDFRIRESAVEVEGVVVTALGISREQRALGYAVQSVSGDQLTEAREPNIINSLAGEIAGVEVKNQGPLGGSARVLIRGVSSISGNNEPLFVVDGVPMDNSSVAGEDIPDYGNALQTLNPDDIASITVLKGANAAALYGSRAANGVVLVTTRSGEGAGDAVQFTANHETTFLTPLRMPVYQNQYGGGSNASGFEWVVGTGSGINDGVDESWGPRLDGSMYQQWDPDAPEGYSMQPWLPRPYSVRDYYSTGLTSTTNFSASARSDRAQGRLSFTRMDGSGTVPTMGLDRTSVFLNAGVDVTERLRFTGSGTYARMNGENRNFGAGGSLYSNTYLFTWWQRQVSMRKLERAMRLFEENGSRWPAGHPANGLPDNWNHNYWDNPYWVADRAWNTDTRDRISGFARLNYQLADWLDAQLQTGTDWYEFRFKRAYPMNAHQHLWGGFDDGALSRQETNTELMLTGSGRLSEAFDLSFSAGGNYRSDDGSDRIVSSERLNVPEIYNPSNSAIPPDIDYQVLRKKVYSVYGLASLAWRNLVFLDVTGRNDWSSSLPEENRSYFYPSVSTSFVFTDALDLSGFLDYGKLRASWAEVGSDADPYRLSAVLRANTPWNGIPSYSPSLTLPASRLRPERTRSFEMGADLRLAGGRAQLDLTYYDASTSDQIIPVPVSLASGYETRIINAGEIRNRGVELQLSADLVRGSDLQWSTTTNWSRNRSEVMQLHEGINTVILGTYARSGLTVEARLDRPFGVLMGTVLQRDDQGRIIVNEQGLPQRAEEKVQVGVAQPDWTAGIRNDVRYKGLALSFLVDWRQGGDVMCGTCQLSRRTGLLAETAAGREDGGIVVDGVREDGTPNDQRIEMRTYWRRMYQMDEMHVYDASFVKLREVKLGFDLPQGLMSHLPFSNARLQVVGRNLALWTDVPHIDPEVDVLHDYGGAPAGIEYLSQPTMRSFGINLSVR
jgi:TonB-linked SusC/RagA family outer membrane protein